MSNPSKAKGTRAETEFSRLMAAAGITLKRTEAGCPWDLESFPWVPDAQRMDVLATRPDRGEWLVTMRYRDVATLLQGYAVNLRVESKRYARFSLHSIFAAKFGRGKDGPDAVIGLRREP